MRYRLVHLSGPHAGHIRDVDEDEGEIVLGRDPDLQVVFPADERLVSRRHAVLLQQDGVLVLRDLDSTSGTFLADQDIEEAELADGDVIELGRGGPRLRVELAEAEGGTIVVSEGSLLPGSGAARLRTGQILPLPPGARLRLTFVEGSRAGTSLELGGSLIRIGRAAGNSVWLPDAPGVSAQHAKIVRLAETFVLLDVESTNGTFLNGARVERARLQHGDVVQLGPGGPAFRLEVLPPDLADHGVHATVVIPNFAELAGRRATGSFVHEVTLDKPVLTIGRDSHADVRLDSPIVSKLHARLVQREGVLNVEDLESANGTYVGGRRIEQAPLVLGDRVVVGPFQIEVLLGRLRVLDTRNRARVDARGLTVWADERPILEDVSLSLAPGSFTAIIGPSGSGKSTLLGALSGARPAGAGRVEVNGVDLYASFDAVRTSIGFVPQDDIVHRELTVAESLDFAASLRLPPDTTPRERQRRCESVLATLELSDRAHLPIHRLSGGQRKRVSIASELLTEPSLLFLDEPASGLDPGLEESLMLLLRELSYKGKTVVLVTHSLDHVHLCDNVVLLVGGRLAFVGKADDVTAHFGITRVAGLYPHLKENAPETWAKEFRESEAYTRRIGQPLANAPAVTAGAPPAPPTVAASPHPLQQLGVLTRRYLTTLTRDARNATLLLAQAPIIAVLIGLSLLYGSSDVAFTKPKNTILFLLALAAVWFGCSNAAREVVKERAIYLRERMFNLGILPYLASKVAVLSLIACAQCVFFLLILRTWFDLPGHPLLLLVGMLASSLVGVLLGLALSCLSSTPDRAMTLLPILLIPQVLFTIPAVHMDMQGPAGIIARAMPTWWGFDLMRRVALAPGDAQSHDVIEARLKSGETMLLTKARFEAMYREGYPVFDYRNRIEVTWTASFPERLARRLPGRLGRWRAAVADAFVLGAAAAGLFLAGALLLKRLDSRR